MGLYDRDYTQAEDSAQRYYGTPQFRFGLPRLTPAVKWLMIVNVAIFLAGVLFPPLERSLRNWFAVNSTGWAAAVHPWTVVTYEFLHADVWHIFFNMIGLYFLGPALENQWGSRKFLLFYLLCGACGGLLYLFATGVGLVQTGSLLGA